MIEFHADDYGLFPEQSRRILDTIENGACNAVSIMPNSPHLDACMKELSELDPGKKVRIAVHLNLVEGTALSAPEQIPLLADASGVFRNSFGRLFCLSLLPGKKRLKEQITAEFAAQISRCQPYIQDGELCLDSHTHIHMIPLVFDSMLLAAGELGLGIRKIRIAREEWKAYRLPGRKLEGKRIINYIKVMILNLCTHHILHLHRGEEWENRISVFSGVLCSGRMDMDVMEIVAPRLIRISESGNTDLELLFHPGGVEEERDFAELTFQPDREFLSHPNRKIEAWTLKEILKGRKAGSGLSDRAM